MSTTPTTCPHCGIPDKMECVSWQGSRRSICFKRQIAALKAELEQAKAALNLCQMALRADRYDDMVLFKAEALDAIKSITSLKEAQP